MKIMIVTDAWEPQVNGVVRTLKNTTRELIALGHRVELLTPLEFKTIPCPTYPEIRLSLLPGRKLRAAHRRVRARRAAYRDRRPARHGRARLRDPSQAAVHDRVSHALSGICAGALRHSAGGDLQVSALVPQAVAGRDGAHAGGQDRTSKNSASRTSCCGRAASISTFSIRWTRRCSTPRGRSFCTWDAWRSRKTSRRF